MTRPILLAIDCSGFDAQVVILQGFEVIAFSQADRQDRSAATLIPLINQTFEIAGISPKQTSAIATTYGPGSFTSLRIGLTTAKLLAFCWNIPTIPVNALDILLLAAIRNQAFTKFLQMNSTHQPSVHKNSVQIHSATNAYRQQFFRKSIQLGASSSLAFPLLTSPPPASNNPKEGFAHEFENVGRPWETQQISQIQARLTEYSTSTSLDFQEIPQFDDADPQPDAMKRFQLNEDRIQSQETRLTTQLWQTLQTTDVQDQSQWLKTLHTDKLGTDNFPTQVSRTHELTPHDAGTNRNQEPIQNPNTKPRIVLSVEPTLAEKLAKPDEISPEILTLAPLNWQKAQALGWLAWQGLLNLDLEELSPFRLQPVYYRASAAEENFAANQ